MTLAPFQLVAELQQLGVPDAKIPVFDDAAYLAPQSSWLLEEFHRWYFRALEAFDIREYEPESGDCDDFAALYCTLARIAHRRTPAGKGYGLPLLRFHFAQIPEAPYGQQQLHAINLARTADLGLIWIDPQVLGQRERLTLRQIQSCFKCTE